MKRFSRILGLVLIVFAIAGFIFWEVKGRETVMLDGVAVASERIATGTVITRELVSKAGIPTENKIYGAVEYNDLNSIVGLVAARDILKNEQISKEHLHTDDFYLERGQSIYVLNPEWITMRSSAIRRGDWIDIYVNGCGERIGTYRIAFVKDSSEAEVTDGDGLKESNPLSRIKSSSVIDHVEIIADIDQYKTILKHVSGGESGLILVQKGGII